MLRTPESLSKCARLAGIAPIPPNLARRPANSPATSKQRYANGGWPEFKTLVLTEFLRRRAFHLGSSLVGWVLQDARGIGELRRGAGSSATFEQSYAGDIGSFLSGAKYVPGASKSFVGLNCGEAANLLVERRFLNLGLRGRSFGAQHLPKHASLTSSALSQCLEEPRTFGVGGTDQPIHTLKACGNDAARHGFEFFGLRHAGPINEIRNPRGLFRQANCV